MKNNISIHIHITITITITIAFLVLLSLPAYSSIFEIISGVLSSSVSKQLVTSDIYKELYYIEANNNLDLGNYNQARKMYLNYRNSTYIPSPILNKAMIDESNTDIKSNLTYYYQVSYKKSTLNQKIAENRIYAIDLITIDLPKSNSSKLEQYSSVSN